MNKSKPSRLEKDFLLHSRASRRFRKKLDLEIQFLADLERPKKEVFDPKPIVISPEKKETKHTN